MEKDPNDPRGLIRESFRIDGITAEECRTIFLDWVLTMPAEADIKIVVRALLATYADADDSHPMTATLQDALAQVNPARRRGGRRARFEN